MKTQNNISTTKSTFGKAAKKYGNIRNISFVLLPVLVTASLAFTGCKYSGTNTDTIDPVVVEVTASHNHETGEHLFETDTEEVPSGWVTFRFINATEHVHFLFLDHLPGDKTVEDQKSEVFPVFQESMYLIMEGKIEEAFANYGKLPAWSTNIVYRGGPGFVSGGNTVETTVFLPSGNYAMECYVKSDDGTYHYTEGMVKGLTVNEETSDAEEPTGADITINLTGQGFGIQGEMTPGQHIVAVSFDEAAPGIFGYDVHLVRLDEDSDINTVTTWMDGFLPAGQVSTHDSPAPAEFLGGAHDMPVGNTAYFSVDLEPGRYAWVAEQPADASMYKEFTVSN